MAPKIGLDAIFNTGDFNKGLTDYLGGVNKAETGTMSASQKMTGGLAAIGGSVVLGALAAAAAAIGVVVGAALAAVPAFTDWAEQLDGIGDVLGTSSEESAALAVVIEKVGGNADSITGQMAFLTRGLVDANGELGPAGEAMDDLGISFRDAEGNLLSSTDILQNVSDVVGVMPDGLDKTRTMMRLFGKSGKDLSDVLGAMAGGGLAEADALAKELGLSLSDDATEGAIQLGREWNVLKMRGKGLMVSLGSQLAPAVGELLTKFSDLAKDVLPKVQEVLPKITDFVIQLADSFITNLPLAFEAVRKVFDFLVNNKPLIIGALAGIAVAIAVWAGVMISTAIPAVIAFMTAMGPAILVILAVVAVVTALGYAWENNFMGMRDTLTAFWETTVKPALAQLWEWLSINIPIALQTLSDFWQNVLLPAINTVWAWIQANLFPLLQQLWDWLSINVPLAIQTLSDFWTTVLLPAITEIWNFVTTSLLPLLMALADFISAVLTVAVEVLSGFWQNVLLPALKDVWSFIQNKVIPIFKKIADYITETFGPVVKDIGEWIQNTFVAAWDALANAIGKVVTWLHDVANALIGLELPDWLVTHSPSPFEQGLRGISDALKELATTRLPAFEASLRISNPDEVLAASSIRANAAVPSTPSARSSIQNTFNLGNNTISNGMDMALFEAHITQVVERTMRSA